MGQLNYRSKLSITSSGITVIQSDHLLKIKHILFYIILLWCVVFSSVLICSITSPLRFLILPACIVFIVIYKFFYLRTEDKQQVKLEVKNEKLSYFIGVHRVTIPINSIYSVEDHSFYSNFEGAENRGWQHSIELTVYYSSIAENLHEITKNFVPDSEGKFGKLIINDLMLSHNDYLTLIRALQDMSRSEYNDRVQ